MDSFWTGTSSEHIFYAVNPLPIHLHRHLYWIVPLLVVGILALIYWAMSSSSDDSPGPQL